MLFAKKNKNFINKMARAGLIINPPPKIVAKKNGHKIERILLNPTIGNIILWRTVYQSEDF